MTGMVQAAREFHGKGSSEYRFDIGSIGIHAKWLANAVRRYSAAENSMHGSLDVAFLEDESRICEHNLAENGPDLHHIASGSLKSDKKTKLGVNSKSLKIG